MPYVRTYQRKLPTSEGMHLLEHHERINWDLYDTDLPLFNSAIKHPDNPHEKHTCELKWLTPEQYIKAQEESIRRFYRDTKRPQERSANELFWSGYFPPHAKKIEEAMLRGDKMPTFVIEVDEEGVTQFQEGRHRIIAARHLGVERVPVWICKRR